MSEKRIELYKTRDFGEKINVTIEYIRYNFKSLIKVMLIVVLPLGIISSLVMKNMFGVFGAFSNPELNESERLAQLSGIGTSYLLSFVLGLLTYSLLIAVVYTLIDRSNKDESLEPMEVVKHALRSVPGLIGLMIITSILTIIGAIVFILPGIYLGVVLSISYPIYMFEKCDIGTAFSKSFKLIKDKWWSTFGLLVITGLIAMVVSYVFVIPMYGIMFGEMFSNMDKMSSDPNAVFEMFSSWTTAIAMAVAMMGSYLTYMIPIIALGFQYFNLSERMEGTGLKNQIQEFENLD